MADNFDRGTAGDRHQVVLHVSADDGAGIQIESPASSVGAPQSAGPAALDGVIEVDHGALYVSMETSRRLACDASLVKMRHDADGAVLDVGRKTRTIPPSIRRALAARDASCRFPGCTSRRCDAHHVDHWADAGATSLDNLVLLCRRHHRAVHEGGFGVIRSLDGVLTFLRPDGTPLPAAPAAPRDLPDLHGATPHVTGKLPPMGRVALRPAVGDGRDPSQHGGSGTRNAAKHLTQSGLASRREMTFRWKRLAGFLFWKMKRNAGGCGSSWKPF